MNLTPGTRQGIIRDERFDAFCMAMVPVEAFLKQVIEDQRKAEEERSSRRNLRKVQRALKEGFLRLPQEEYDWFDIQSGKTPKKKDALFSAASTILAPRDAQDREAEVSEAGRQMDDGASGQMEFFEFAGPLFSVLISPKSSVIPIDQRKKYRAVCRDRSRRIVVENLDTTGK